MLNAHQKNDNLCSTSFIHPMSSPKIPAVTIDKNNSAMSASTNFISHSHRPSRGFAMLVVLCFLPIILTVIAYIASIVLDFHEISFIALREKRGQEELRAEIERIISEDLPKVAERTLLVNPSLASLEVRGAPFEIYSMNYTFSGDLSGIANLSKFPPSKISSSDEQNFFIRATREPNTKGVVAHRVDAAVEVSGDAGKILWWREYTVY